MGSLENYYGLHTHRWANTDAAFARAETSTISCKTAFVLGANKPAAAAATCTELRPSPQFTPRRAVPTITRQRITSWATLARGLMEASEPITMSALWHARPSWL